MPAEILLPANETASPAAAPPAAPWLATLTNRELEVLRGVARGLSNKQIGRELNLAFWGRGYMLSDNEAEIQRAAA